MMSRNLFTHFPSRLVFLKKTSKGGQVSMQVFIYVIAIIIFSLILIYGYNAVRGFKEKSERISYIKFKTDLTSAVDRISPDYGTLRKEEFFLGGEYTKVCFVQSYKKEKNFDDIKDHIDDPLIQNSFESKVEKNVFLFTNSLQESFDIGDINLTGGYNCTFVRNGKVKIQLEGKGDHALISNWG